MKEDQKKAAVYGGEDVQVADISGWNDNVQVRLLPIRQLQKLGDLINDEAALVALYTGRDDAWVDALTMLSVQRILEVGDRLNFPNLQILMKRRSRRSQDVVKFLEEVRKDLQTSSQP